MVKYNEIKGGKAVKTLKDITPGGFATVKEIITEGDMRRRLLDIGLIPGTRVECIGKSPGGDPKAFLIRGAVSAIRAEDADGIAVE